MYAVADVTYPLPPVRAVDLLALSAVTAWLQDSPSCQLRAVEAHNDDGILLPAESISAVLVRTTGAGQLASTARDRLSGCCPTSTPSGRHPRLDPSAPAF